MPRFDQRPSGIDITGALPWGTHFCVMYASTRELFEVVVPFIRAGVECNEACIWEVHPPLSVEEAAQAMAEAVVDFPQRVARGQIQIVPASNAIDARATLDERIVRRLDEATLNGFDGLRLVQHAVNGAKEQPLAGRPQAIRSLNVLAAVVYPRETVDARGFMQVVQDHRFALICNAGRWELLEGSEAHSAREALARSEQKLQSLFSNMSEAFAFHRIVLDADGRPCDYVFLEVSPSFERLTQLEGSKILRKRVTQVFPGIESDPTDWIGKYGRVAVTGEPLQFESHFAHLGKWFSVSAFSPYKGYFAVTFSDITARKNAEAELERALMCEREARREAEIANRTKDDFLANVSHELRSPLNAILGWAVMLRSGQAIDEEARRRALETIERSARSQRQLIEDLLDLARITSGKIRLDVQEVELIPVIEAAIDTVRPMADAKRIRLQVIVDPKAAPVSGDPDRLQQIVWNLLSNAIKFSDKGGDVQVRLERRDSSIEIVVSDTGSGIDPALLPHVFERFRQASGGRRAGGLGLGLAIVRELVELHGGTVHAESAGTGRGATFTVRLPLRAVRRESRSAAPPPAPSVSAETAASLRGVRVLAVDDDAETRAMLQVMLENAGAEAHIVATAREALAALKASPWDVLVSDIEMPECDGYSLIQQVRQTDLLRGSPLPAVALTAYARTQDRVRAISAGFNIHVAKPVEPAELLAVVASLAARAVRPV